MIRDALPHLACHRLKEAVTEIKKLAKSDPVLKPNFGCICALSEPSVRCRINGLRILS